MNMEFTGERVVPGQVDNSLWNEHFARYAFAARLARNRRVLDLGCGSGYGSAELARRARHVVAVDIAQDAIEYARETFPSQTVYWTVASATSLPMAAGSFDLIVAFEVIEHLEDWENLLIEARRLLAPGGQFVVSTPNQLAYADARGTSGPNPYHVHEFEYAEFREVLSRHFSDVRMFAEDHAEGIVFQSLDSRGSADIRIDGDYRDPSESNFYVAVCAMTNQTGAPAFVYLPSSGNLLREREAHIRKLDEELKKKNDWLNASRSEHQQLVILHQQLQAELEQRNHWAQQLNERIRVASERIAELEKDDAYFAAIRAAYEEKIADLERENLAKTAWALDTEKRLGGEIEQARQELTGYAEALQKAESALEERTRWAQELDRRRDALETVLSLAASSRWVRIGRKLGVGPELRNA